MPWRYLVAVAASTLFLATQAGDPWEAAKQEVQPRIFSWKSESIDLADALKWLEAQTGNTVADRRQIKSNPKLTFDPRAKVSFWSSLDDLVKQVGCGLSLYQPDGQLALVDTRNHPVATAYSGIFRIAAKRIGATRDFETGTHVAMVTLEIAWEPRFQPFYLDVGPMAAAFANADGKKGPEKTIPGRGQMQVVGRSAALIDASFPAPPRSSPKIAALGGQFKLLGPSRMLTFTFDDLPALQKNGRLEQTQEGVKV